MDTQVYKRCMSQQFQDNNEAISLNKYISATGFCSRREADEYIEQGRVTINNKLARSGSRVSIGDNVEIDGEPLKKNKKHVPLYIAFNKPVGITSTTDLKDRTNIISYINYPKRIFPIGRLDKESDGLILLTNDGDIVNKVLRAGNYHEKEYVVMVDKPVTPDFMQQMSNGVPILGKMTRKCVVKQESNKRFRIILTQGMNRQIRRMCQHLGYKVVTLTRIRIMNIKLGTLQVGAWRALTAQEIEEMNRMIASSSKTEEASDMTVNIRVQSKNAARPKQSREFKQPATQPVKTKDKANKKPASTPNAIGKKTNKPATATGKTAKTSYKEWRKRK